MCVCVLLCAGLCVLLYAGLCVHMGLSTLWGLLFVCSYLAVATFGEDGVVCTVEVGGGGILESIMFNCQVHCENKYKC